MTDYFLISSANWYIHLILAVLYFFGLKWLLGRFISHEKLRLGLSITGAVLLEPLLYRAFIYLFVFVLFHDQHIPDQQFDQVVWMEDVNNRFTMRNDLVENHKIVGLQKSEVIDLLGYPGGQDQASLDTLDIWYFGLGTQLHGFGIKGHYLEVYYKDGEVDSVNLEVWVD